MVKVNLFARNLKKTIALRQMKYQSAGKRYEEDIQLVVEGQPRLGAIFISNKEAAENPATLSRCRIKAVLSAAKGLHLSHPNSLVPLYKYIPAEDHEAFNLSVYFEEAVRFISEARRVGNVLVHCMAGISRSVSLVIAYLIREKALSFDEAYAKLKRNRPVIQPNSGFVSQLRKYASEQRAYDQRSYHRNDWQLRPHTSFDSREHQNRSFEPRWDYDRPLSPKKRMVQPVDYSFRERNRIPTQPMYTRGNTVEGAGFYPFNNKFAQRPKDISNNFGILYNGYDGLQGGHRRDMRQSLRRSRAELGLMGMERRGFGWNMLEGNPHFGFRGYPHERSWMN